MSDLDEISNLERRWQAEEESRRVGASLGKPAKQRPAPSAAELDQAARLAAARALPDAVVMGDARAQELHAAHQARILVSDNQGRTRRWLLAERAHLAADIGAAGEALAWAALVDGANKDSAFALTSAELVKLQASRDLIGVIDSALALLTMPPNANTDVSGEVERTSKELGDHLLALKLARIDDDQAQSMEATHG